MTSRPGSTARGRSEPRRSSPAGSDDRAWVVVLVVGFAACALGIAVPDTRVVTGVVSAGIALVGGARFVTRNTRDAIQPIIGLLLAVGPLGVLGMVAADVQEAITGRPPAFPGISEIFFALSYVGLIIGMERLRRARTDDPDREGLIDGAIVATAVLLVVWVTVLGPVIRSTEQSGIAAATRIGFALASGAVIALTARLAIGPGARAMSWYLLGVAVTAFVAADVAAAAGPEVPAVLAPLVFTFFGAAMLHPSMPTVVERDPRPVTTVGPGRFVVLAVALLVAPVTLVLLVRSQSSQTDLLVDAGGAAVLSALVLTRLSLMLRAGTAQARMEQTLRHASDRLLLATDVPSLDDAAVEAVRMVVGTVPGAEVHSSETVPIDDVRAEVALGRSRDRVLTITAPHRLPALVVRALRTFEGNLALATESAELAEALQRSKVERRFRVLVENSSDLTVVVSPDGTASFVSPAANRLLGRSDLDLTGTPARDLAIADDAHLIDELVRQTAEAVFTLPVEVRLDNADGDARWFEIAARDLTRDGEVAGIVLNCREITDRKDAELRLHRSEARFRALVQNVSDVVAILDDYGRFTYVSPAITRLLGYTPEQLHNTPATAIVMGAERESVQGLLDSALGSGDASNIEGLELRVLTIEGDVRTIDVTATDLRGDPAVRGLVLNARDVTVRKQLESTLRHQADHDALTGLANRTRFTRLVDRAAADRNIRACVLFVDLDDFKTVNDSLGHIVGDDLLVAVAQRLTDCLPPGTVAARLGGDEFAVLVRSHRDDDLGPVGVALRLLHELRAPFDIDGWEIVVTASIGIALIGDDDAADVVLRNADMAMYLAKERGKDRVELFEEAMHVTAFERLELKADLARAITAGQLALVYQPIVSLETGRITGAEALVRWDHPRRGRLAPDAFIGIAEETGLIVQLGQWVLEEACQQLRTWQLGLPSGAALSMSVNLSVRQLEHPSIVDSVRHVIGQFALDPSTLTLEITETVVIDHMEDDRSRLTELKDIGVQVALDDFGVGYSSLRYADDLPVDVLKVDRSFVAGITGVETTPVLEAIVALGRRLGVHTVAEGIENPGQIGALRSIGCDLGQGYWFSPPVAPDAFVDLLERNLDGEVFDTSSGHPRDHQPDDRN